MTTPIPIAHELRKDPASLEEFERRVLALNDSSASFQLIFFRFMYDTNSIKGEFEAAICTEWDPRCGVR